jgi:hypothetical protein
MRSLLKLQGGKTPVGGDASRREARIYWEGHEDGAC